MEVRKKGTTMTKLVFDLEPDSKEDEWTTSRLKDECFLCLTKVEDNDSNSDFIDGKKYYRQAIQKKFRIPLTEQILKSKEEAVPFVINISDLTGRIQEEFQEYCKLHSKEEIYLFLKEIVIRIFENIDFEYTHMSIIKKLRLVLEP